MDLLVQSPGPRRYPTLACSIRLFYHQIISSMVAMNFRVLSDRDSATSSRSCPLLVACNRATVLENRIEIQFKHVNNIKYLLSVTIVFILNFTFRVVLNFILLKISGTSTHFLSPIRARLRSRWRNRKSLPRVLRLASRNDCFSNSHNDRKVDDISRSDSAVLLRRNLVVGSGIGNETNEYIVNAMAGRFA